MWSEQILSFATFEEKLRNDPLDDWLSPAEADRLMELSAPRRRLSWLGGRWLAKELLRGQVADLHLSRSDLHIESRNARGRGSRPQVFLRGRLQPWQVSISHTARFLYVSVATSAGYHVGVDVTPTQTLSRGFLDFWLTPAERDWCRRTDDSVSACLVWSLKESWFKSAGGDQPFVPKRWDMVHAAASLWPSCPQHSAPSFVRGTAHRWLDEEVLVVCHRLPGEIATLVVRRNRVPGPGAPNVFAPRRTL